MPPYMPAADVKWEFSNNAETPNMSTCLSCSPQLQPPLPLQRSERQPSQLLQRQRRSPSLCLSLCMALMHITMHAYKQQRTQLRAEAVVFTCTWYRQGLGLE